MRALRPSSVALACALALSGAGCGDGASAVHVTPDAGADARDARDASDVEAVDASAGDAELDAPADASETSDVGVDANAGSDTNVDANDASDAPPSLSEAGPDATVDGAKDAMPDLPIEKPSATANWTIGANPMCTAAGAGCMDTGAVGGYQVTASGTCPTASSVQLWFPGGASPHPAGSVKGNAAAAILGVL